MEKNIKDYLGISIISALSIMSISLLWFVYSYNDSIEPPISKSFSVSAEGKAVAIPDIAQFSFWVITDGKKDIPSLIEENTAKTNKIISFIKKSGVEEEDIKTLQYSIEPRYQYYNCGAPRPVAGNGNPCPLPEIAGYIVRQGVSVKIRDFEKIGEIISGVGKRGANKISGLSFNIDDTDALQTKARKEAIEKARKKAEEIADAGNFRIGKLLSIEEGYTPYYRYGISGKTEQIAINDAQTPSIEPGSQEISVTVTLKYEIR